MSAALHTPPNRPTRPSRGRYARGPAVRQAGTPGWQHTLYRAALIPAACAAYLPATPYMGDWARFGLGTALMCWAAWALDPWCAEVER